MKAKLIPVIALAALLGGCQTVATVPSQVISVVTGYLPQDIQARVVQACGWVEPVTTIAAIVANLGGPTVPGIVNQVVSEICTAVTPPRTASRGRSTSYRVAAGVRLQGGFAQ